MNLDQLKALARKNRKASELSQGINEEKNGKKNVRLVKMSKLERSIAFREKCLQAVKDNQAKKGN